MMKLSICATALVALTGCVSPHPEANNRFGQAVNSAKHAQTLNPQGTRPVSAVSGIDGRAAKETMDRYVDSFKAPPPTLNVFNIGGPVTDK
jgi:hypothetical protein